MPGRSREPGIRGAAAYLLLRLLLFFSPPWLLRLLELLLPRALARSLWARLLWLLALPPLLDALARPMLPEDFEEDEERDAIDALL